MPIANLPSLKVDYADPINIGQVGWWPMNEGAGSACRDIAKGNSATATNGASAASGILGAARAFATASNQYLSAPDAPQYAFGSQVSVSCWVSVRSYSTWTRFVARGIAGCSPPYTDLLLGLYGYGGTTPRWALNVGGGLTECAGSFNLSLHTWYFLCGTYDGATMRLYINSRLDAISTSRSGAITNTAYAISFGQEINGCTGDAAFDGRLANARIWNRALPQTDVQRLYVTPFAGALSPRGVSRYFVPPRPVVPPPVVAATGGVNYNQARQAWVRREDEEWVILNGRHP